MCLQVSDGKCMSGSIKIHEMSPEILIVPIMQKTLSFFNNVSNVLVHVLTRLLHISDRETCSVGIAVDC